MYRIRTKPGTPLPIITIGEVPWLGHWATPGLPTIDTWSGTPSSYTTPNVYNDVEEEIRDEHGTAITGRHEKSCYHETETNDFSAPIVPYLSFNGGTNVPAVRVDMAMIEALHVHILGTVARPDMELLRRKAVNTMRPHLKSALSVLNFILELKDLKSWGKVGNALQRIRGTAKPSSINLGREARKKWGESLPYSDLSYKMPGGRIKMLKDIVKRLSGAHLQASFGIIPLISDLCEAFTGLNEMQVKLQTLKRFANRRQVRRYRYLIPPSSDDGSLGRQWHQLGTNVKAWVPPYDTDSRPHPVYHQKWRWNKAPIYHAKMVYKYTLPSMTEAEEKAKLLFETIGLKFDPSIVWNAIPFSFVVDWVIDVSSFLKSFSRSNFPIITQVIDFSESYSYHYECEVSVQGAYKDKFLFAPVAHEFEDRYGKEYSMGTVYRGTSSIYDRQTPVVTLDSHAIAIKTPGEREAFLSGSLFISRALGSRQRFR
jgi:hypothetical protein